MMGQSDGEEKCWIYTIATEKSVNVEVRHKELVEKLKNELFSVVYNNQDVTYKFGIYSRFATKTH